MNTKWALVLIFQMWAGLLVSGCGISAPAMPTGTPTAAAAATETSLPPTNTAEAETPTSSAATAPTLMPPHPSLRTPKVLETMTVTVYFSPDGQDDCAAVAPFERITPASEDIAGAALNQLFAGATEEERAQGYSSWFSGETASLLLSLRIDGNKAYLNLKDFRSIIPGANSSCGSQMFFAQIETTLKNAAPVESVFYAISGDPVAFYEWMQIGCDPELINCDAAPFAVSP
jgi:spore germination protein GerM